MNEKQLKEEKEKYTNDLRLTILENSLFHEYLITQSLGDILEIDIQSSYSLSDKGSALSLASKINLLIDLKSLDKKQKPKLFFYLEIRNQFLHNWKCKTFEDCFKSLEGTHKALKKLYPSEEDWDAERQMTFQYNSLSDDIVDIAINHLTKNVINAKAKREIQKKDLEKYKKMRSEVIEYAWDLLNSSELSKYDIPFDDKRKLISSFMDRIFK